MVLCSVNNPSPTHHLLLKPPIPIFTVCISFKKKINQSTSYNEAYFMHDLQDSPKNKNLHSIQLQHGVLWQSFGTFMLWKIYYKHHQFIINDWIPHEIMFLHITECIFSLMRWVHKKIWAAANQKFWWFAAPAGRTLLIG